MTKQQRSSLAASVSASWADPKVRAARVSRVAVRVGKTVYPSMAYALADNAPWLASKVIALRMRLRAEGVVEVEGKKFVRVDA